jgi:hypothetical protein
MPDMPAFQKRLDQIKQFRKEPVSLSVIIRAVLLKRFGFPDLWLRWPQGIWHLCRALMSPSPFPVFAFSSFEIWLRSYYSKLSWNFRMFGRWGYVWDESLGFPMGPRFGSNWATYFIYGRLSARQFSLLSVSLFLTSIMSVGAFLEQIMFAGVLCLVLLGSPAVIFSIATRLVKPEIIWWPFSIPMIVLALNNEWQYVWLIIGFLLLVNTSASIILGAVSGMLFLGALLSGYTNWTSGLIWLVLGAGLRGWRFLHAYLDGNLEATVREQSKVSKRGKKIKGHSLQILKRSVQYATRLLLPFLLAAWGNWHLGLVMFVVLLCLFMINEYGFKVADQVTLDVITLCAITSLALLSKSWWSLLGVGVFVLNHPFKNSFESWGRVQKERLERERDQASPVRPSRNQFYAKLARAYPWFTPLPFPESHELTNLFNAIPEYSRFLMEGDGDPRSGGNFARFHDWAYHYIAVRNVEFVNHTFLNRMLEPDLAETYLNCLSASELAPGTLADVCKRLGVRYFIAFSEETASALQSCGYRRVLEVRPESYQAVSDLLYMPEKTLVLLEGPESTSIISPMASWHRDRNQITWQAEAGKEYIVHYRYYAKFKAKQEGVRINVLPYQPFDNLSLRFMHVHAEKDGRLELKYG